MITYVDDERRTRDLPSLEAHVSVERQQIENRRDSDLEARAKKLENDLAELEAEGAKADVRRKVREGAEREMKQLRDRAQREIDRLDEVWSRFKNLKVQDLEGDELLYRELRDRFGTYFDGSMGAAALQKRLESFDLEEEAERLREIIRTGKGQKKTRALKRLKVVSAFLQTANSPKGMVLDCVPVIPPDLRPMVQLDGGRFATSDLNDLYRRVINRNNRLKRLLDLGAPEIIVNNEKRMLQEAVDALFDNGRRGRPVTGPGNRPLKSLSDMLKGKQGRFRQNLLGKRVDYSARSVIVVGPQLKLHQCGLPKAMALELFKPFVMKRLVDLNHAQNIKSAKRMVERGRTVVYDVLEEVIAEHPVLLNRAPTLHRLGIQAFEPQLVEGKAIQIHPLVCTAFNADFDGDQMAVHLPLSAEAQAEARILMLSSNNILKPADGRPVTMPTQDMVLGLFFLTTDGELRDTKGEGRAFGSTAEAIMAFDAGELALQSPIDIRFPVGTIPPRGWTPPAREEASPSGSRGTRSVCAPPWAARSSTSCCRGLPVRRLLGGQEAAFRDRQRPGRALPQGHRGGDARQPEGVRLLLGDPLRRHRGHLRRRRPRGEEGDRRRVRGAGREGPEAVRARSDHQGRAHAGAHRDLDQGDQRGRRGDERELPKTNPIFMMVDSGARGNMMQMRQIAGMRGLVSNAKNETIPRPIKASFREGLSVLEYFISTHGARKGLADTALRTADSGYLTRRLVDVSQDVIIREEDCGTERGLKLRIAAKDETGVLRKTDDVETSVYARMLAEDVVVDGKVIAPANVDLGDVLIDALVNAGVEEVKTRSVLTCESAVGTCAFCYGRSLATGKLVDIGEAVGIIAAQSIGEPGTQLTMRTFHTGGVAGDDITQGLPRVVELFEARQPKGVAPISEAAGRVRIEETEKTKKIVVTPDDGSDETAFPISKRARLLVGEGDHVEVGQKLTVGATNPHDVLRILGQRAVQVHLVGEVQKVYNSQGVSIHDKHIEIIIRQMLRRVTIIESGDAELLPGELVERSKFETENRRVVTEGGHPASGRPQLMGITKASLATESWLSAASFQETTRVLTDAAINAKSDSLIGLKENVIIGKLIPAGTGLSRYRNIRVEPTEEAKAAMYSAVGYDDIDYSPFGSGSGQAVPLEDYDYGPYNQ